MSTLFLVGFFIFTLMYMVQDKKQLALASVLFIILTGCYDNHSPEMTTFTLTDGKREQKLRILSVYYANDDYNKKTKGSYVIVNCIYPSMVARDRGLPTLPTGDIRLVIEMGGISRAEFFMSKYKNSKSSYVPTEMRRTSKEGDFEVYTKILPLTNNIESMKIKKGPDNYTIGLNDAGPSEGSYRVSRRIDEDIHIFYQFDKNIKDSFEKIDSKVVALVKSFMTQ
jgi:hypothetical protein